MNALWRPLCLSIGLSALGLGLIAPAFAQDSPKKASATATKADKAKLTDKKATTEKTKASTKTEDKTKTTPKSKSDAKSDTKPECKTIAKSDLFPDGGVTPTELIAEIKKAGHKAKLMGEKSAEPVIEASFTAGDDDVPYRIFFFGCKKGRCASLQYFVSFDGPTSRVAKWNEDHRFARAYSANKRINLEYDVDVEEGTSGKALQNSAKRWKTILVSAATFFQAK